MATVYKSPTRQETALYHIFATYKTISATFIFLSLWQVPLLKVKISRPLTITHFKGKL